MMRVQLYGSAAVVALSIGLLLYTVAGIRLNAESALLPIVGLAASGIGGLLVFVRSRDDTETERTYPGLAIAVLFSIVMLGRLVEGFGLAVSTALFLWLWWTVLRLRADSAASVRHVLVLLLMAMLTGIAIYVLLVRLLGFYVPNTLMF